MSTVALDVEAVRARFSALRQPLAFFDGPGGTQVPDEVIDAVSAYYRESNANVSGPYATSRRTEALVTQARARWPDDPAFVRLAAQAAIAEGRAREGVELVTAMGQPDAPALLAALAALYDAGQRGVPVFDPQRDLETMQHLRESYAAANGDALGLVDSWIAETAKRSPHASEK